MYITIGREGILGNNLLRTAFVCIFWIGESLLALIVLSLPPVGHYFPPSFVANEMD